MIQTGKTMKIPTTTITASTTTKNQGLDMFTSSLYIAGLVALMFVSPMTRNHGQKASIISGGISSTIGATLNAGVMNLPMIIIGHVMLEVGIGFANQVGFWGF